MAPFILRSKPTLVSTEQVRAFLHASCAVLSYHNLIPSHRPLIVRFLQTIRFNGSVAWNGLWHGNGLIDIQKDLNAETMLTTCLHELIHDCREFPKSTEEKCVSTLTARLK